MDLRFSVGQSSKHPNRHHNDFARGHDRFPIVPFVAVPRKQQTKPKHHHGVVGFDFLSVAPHEKQTQRRQPNNVHQQLWQDKKKEIDQMPILVAWFFQIGGQPKPVAHFFARQQRKRLQRGSGVQQIQAHHRGQDCFVFVGKHYVFGILVFLVGGWCGEKRRCQSLERFGPLILCRTFRVV